MQEEIKLEEPIETFEKIVSINRVAKVTKGGKKLSFNALTVVGEPSKGRVGYGLGKANEVSDAIRKGINLARKNMIEVPLKGTTIIHTVTGHHGAAYVLLRPASKGTGIIACSPVRAVLEAAGVKDVLTKSLKSNNPINIVKATIDGLKRVKRVENETLSIKTT